MQRYRRGHVQWVATGAHRGKGATRRMGFSLVGNRLGTRFAQTSHAATPSRVLNDSIAPAGTPFVSEATLVIRGDRPRDQCPPTGRRSLPEQRPAATGRPLEVLRRCSQPVALPPLRYDATTTGGLRKQPRSIYASSRALCSRAGALLAERVLRMPRSDDLYPLAPASREYPVRVVYGQRALCRWLSVLVAPERRAAIYRV